MAEHFDIVIGIPTYNEATTISRVTQVVDEGLQCHFPSYRAVILNLDSRSDDQTVARFVATKTYCAKKVLSCSADERGKGLNILNLLRYATCVRAIAMAAFDGDSISIMPHWVGAIIQPLLWGADYTLPVYERGLDGGRITKLFCRPMVRSLTGVSLHQPIGGDFGLSPRFSKYCLRQQACHQVKGYGIDIWLTLHALHFDGRVCQVELGIKEHRHSSIDSLVRAFTEVAGSLLFTAKSLRTHTAPFAELVDARLSRSAWLEQGLQHAVAHRDEIERVLAVWKIAGQHDMSVVFGDRSCSEMLGAMEGGDPVATAYQWRAACLRGLHCCMTLGFPATVVARALAVPFCACLGQFAAIIDDSGHLSAHRWVGMLATAFRQHSSIEVDSIHSTQQNDGVCQDLLQFRSPLVMPPADACSI